MTISAEFFEYEIETTTGRETVAFRYGDELPGTVFEEASEIESGDKKMYFILRKAARTPKDYKKLLSLKQKFVNEFQEAYTEANKARNGKPEDQ